MTITNPDSGYAPSLSDHLSTCYNKALRLSGVVKAIAHLTNDGGCNDSQICLIYLADELAADLLSHLDYTPSTKAVVA